ncbi:MAG: FAD binding domain-containing protein [Firmicutes bacterium]|nr:FAD binding domain-containing protein [Bacillota bacterium]
MKPPPFRYWRPQSRAEALEGLADMVQQGYQAKVLAGGQSLMPMLNMRLTWPDVLVDLNGLGPELTYIHRDGPALRVGALTRHYMLETDPMIQRLVPIIAQAEPLIGHLAIRSRGTVGGSLAHADPSAELPLLALLLGARMRVESVRGSREVPSDEFFVTYLTTALASDEILTEIVWPVIPPRSGQAIQEYALRHGDFALAAAAAQVTVDDDGAIVAGRLALGGVSATPLDVSHEVFSRLVGCQPEDQEIGQATEAIRDLVDPMSDIHADSEYRRELAVTLARRAVREAWEAAVQAQDRLQPEGEGSQEGERP